MKNGINSCGFKLTALLATLLLSPIVDSNSCLCEAATKKKTTRSSPSPATQSTPALTTPDPRTPVEHNNRAVELGSRGLWPQAIHEHEEALAGDPYNKEFRNNLSAAQLRYGDVLASRNDFYNAIKQYRGALYIDATNTPADQNLDICLKHLGKNPDDWHVRQKMAEDANVSGDYETAIVEYRKVVKMKDDGPSHYDLGQVLLKAGKTVDAFAELKLAAAKSWDKKEESIRAASDCHRQLGDILKEYAFIAKSSGRGTIGMKRLLNAGIEYRRAVTLNSSNMDAARGLLECAREAVAINPSFDNHLALGAAYQLIGDFEHAKLEYVEAWKLNPANPALPIARKSFYLAVAKNPLTSPAVMLETLQKVQETINKNQNDAELWYIFGKIKDRQGEKSAALEAYQKAASINPYINPDLSVSMKLLGSSDTTQTAQPQQPGQSQPVNSNNKEKISTTTTTTTKLLAYSEIEKQMREGDLDGAQKQLLSLIDKNNKDGHTWLLLGNIYEKKGDLDQAVVAYRQASYLKETTADEALRTIDTSRVQPMLKEAEAAAKENNWVKAAASLREAASIAPGLSLVHKKLSEAMRQLGDNKEAAREQKKATELDKQ